MMVLTNYTHSLKYHYFGLYYIIFKLFSLKNTVVETCLAHLNNYLMPLVVGTYNMLT